MNKIDIKSLLEHGLLTRTATNEYTLQAGDDFTQASILLADYGWLPLSHDVHDGMHRTVYTPVGIPDAYERLRKDTTLTYKVLHSGKLLQAIPTSKKTFGWPVQFEIWDITDQKRTKVRHFVRRFYLNREDVAGVFYSSGIQEVAPEQREDIEPTTIKETLQAALATAQEKGNSLEAERIQQSLSAME